MVKAALRSKKLNVCEMREPGQREPVQGLRRGDRPAHSRRCETAERKCLAAIVGVIIFHEVEAEHFGIQEKCGGKKKEVYPNVGEAAKAWSFLILICAQTAGLGTAQAAASFSAHNLQSVISVLSRVSGQLGDTVFTKLRK